MTTTYHWEKKESAGSWTDFEGTPTIANPTEDFDAGTWDVRVTVSDGVSSDTKTRLAYVVASAAPSYTGPLDLMPGATVAFDQFAPSAAWLAGTNNYALLRRDSDDEELQFQYAADGSVPVAAIIAWRDEGGAADAFFVAWNDGSGNGKNVTVADPSAQPLFTSSLYGSVPALDFGPFGLGDERYLASSSAVTLTDGAYTVFIVCNPTQAGVGFLGFGYEAFTGEVFAVYLNDNAIELDATTDGMTLDGAGGLTDNVTGLKGANHIIECKWAFGSKSVKVDGVAATFANDYDIAAVGSISEQLCVGQANVPPETGDFFHGNIAAEYVWSGIKSDADCLSVRQMLATRYSITLSLTAPVATPDPATAGNLLSTTNGTWADAGDAVFTYQWYLDGSPVMDATAATYQSSVLDATKEVYCLVTNTNTWGALSVPSNTLTLGIA